VRLNAAFSGVQAVFSLVMESCSDVTVWCVQYCQYHVVAEGYGGVGMLLDRSNEAQMEDVFIGAQRAASEGRSVLVNCLIGKTSFRDGSISV